MEKMGNIYEKARRPGAHFENGKSFMDKAFGSIDERAEKYQQSKNIDKNL